MKKWLQDFLENEPPYKAIGITLQELNFMSTIESITISHFCNICNKSRTFKCFNTAFKEIEQDYQQFLMDAEWEMGFEEFHQWYKNVFFLKFSCTHECDEDHYIVILIDKGSIQKIGQYPTFAKEEVNKKLVKYKSLIPKYYPELTKAVSAYSKNMGVPSFVYLRRILEHLVESKYKIYGGIDNIKFVEKLKEVEKQETIIPVEFQEIKKQLYAVLSKGIHEYEEDECLDMFPSVKFIIESILDAELIKVEHKKKAQEAKEIIQKRVKKDEA